MIEGSLEAKLPTIWTDEKHGQEEAEPGTNSNVEKVRREKIRDGESQKREDANAQNDSIEEASPTCPKVDDFFLHDLAIDSPSMG